MPVLATRPREAARTARAPGPRARPSRAILALALLGAVDAGYLSYRHLFWGGACAGGGCDAVLDSPYACVAGVPLAAIGLGLYVALAVAARRGARGWVRWLAVAGNLATPYLLYVQAVRLERWCLFCLASTALLAAILVLSLRARAGRPASSLAPPLAFLAPVLLVAGLQQALAARDARRALSRPAGAVARGSVTIDGETFSREEIDRALDRELSRLAWEAHRARLAWVDRTVLEREAEVRDVTPEELKRDNVDFKVVLAPGDVERAYRAQGGTEEPIPESVRRELTLRLVLEKRRAVEEAFRAALHEKHGVSIDLPPPGTGSEPAFNPRHGPERGPADAPLRVIVFSDFSCAACARVHAWLEELPDRLGAGVRIAFRHFPAARHAGAKDAARAAIAAHAQGRFWEFADVLFRRRGPFDARRLEACAREAGLDLDVFREALRSGRPQRALAADLAEGRELGVQATPGLFLNGVYFPGVPDLRLVRAVLERDAAAR